MSINLRKGIAFIMLSVVKYLLLDGAQMLSDSEA